MFQDVLSLVRPEFKEIKAYVPEKHPGVQVFLDANEAPAAETTLVREVVARALAEVALERYPDAQAVALKHAIAERTGARPEELLVGSGTDEVIALILHGLSRPRAGRAAPTVLVPSPTFVMYKVSGRAYGFDVLEAPLDDGWDLDVPALKRLVDAHAPNVIFLASPNNPTSNVYSEGRIVDVLELATSSFVVVDEAYGDFAGESLRRLRERFPHLGILRTLSKVGLAALRVGWLEADEALVRELDKGRQPFNVSATSQAAATAVLREAWSDVQHRVREVVRERERLAAEVRALGGGVTPSRANFLWVHTPRPAVDVYNDLARRGVLVRHYGGGERLAHQLRITVGSPAENDRLVSALRAASLGG
jgi:histidinol-phosphate aminotransferase